MTNQDSTKRKQRDNNIIPIDGAKGTTFKVIIRKKGYATISKTFPTRKEAREWRDKVKGSPDLMGRLGGAGANMTLGDLIDDYGNNYQGKDKSVPAKLELWKNRFGHLKVAEVTRHIVAAELKRLKTEPALQPISSKRGAEAEKATPREASRTRSQATVNRYLSTLSQVFNQAVDDGLIDTNPCRGIKRGGETHRFGRALSDDERKALLKACQESEYDRLYLLVSLALSTGARLGELMSLTWADLDLKKAVAKLSDTKNGSPRHLPIIPPVLEQIQALPRPIDSTECLFPGESKDKHKSYVSGFRKHWDQALADAKIENFRFHDLRHSAASYLTEAGVPLVTVAEILGHKTMSMVQRYSHVATQHKADVVNEKFKDLLG